MASEQGDSSSSQDVTPVPAVALVQSQNEVLLPSNNCPNCKLLSRHLKISREWNNFFRLKLDQRDMLLHVAADYKRQKQRCLQLQMSLDQQSRECGEMREQLTNLLLEMNPLRERVQVAEDAVKEERVRREKAESSEYNLRFLVDQQAHKIKACEKLKPNLTEILEKRLVLLRSEVKRLKKENSLKSRSEWELKQQVSLAHSKHQRTLKKTRWGLSLALKYGSHLLSQGHLLQESSPEWVRLKTVHREVENVLHKQYLALCQHIQVRPLEATWLDDFDAECEDEEVGGEDREGKQLENIIASDGEEEICLKTKGDGDQYYKSDISKAVEKGSPEHRPVRRCEMPCSRTPKKDLPEVVTTSASYTPPGNRHNTVHGAASHVVDSCCSEDEKGLTKSTSILDTSGEEIESDPLPKTDVGKDKKGLAKSTSILDTSGEDIETDPLPNRGGNKHEESLTKLPSILNTSVEIRETDPLSNRGGNKHEESLTKLPSILNTGVEIRETDPLPNRGGNQNEEGLTELTSAEDIASDSIPRCHDSIAGTTFGPPDTGMDTVNHVKTTSTDNIATEDPEIDPRNTGMDTVKHINTTSTDNIATKDPESNPSNSTVEAGRHTSDRVTAIYPRESIKQRSNYELLPRPQDSDVDPAIPSLEPSDPGPSVTSYHLDEELRVILQKMKPHEKLEDMDALSPYSSEGHSHPKTGVHDPYVIHSLLAPLSESEEDEQEMKIHNGEDEIGDEISVPLRIFTTQMSEGFSVGSSYRDNILQDDLDLSTDTLDPDDEREEEKVHRKRASTFSFPSTQSFSCDLEDSVPPPGLESEEAEKDNVSIRHQKQCQHHLQQPVHKGVNNNRSCTDTPNTQNKESHKEQRVRLAVVNSAGPDGRGPVGADAQEMFNEEDKGDCENEEALKGVRTKTPEPRNKQNTGVVKAERRTIMEECTIETPQESLENINKETVGKEGRTEVTEPQKKQKFGVMKAERRTIVEERTIETPQESLENINKETIDKEARAEIDRESLTESKTRKPLITMEQKLSTHTEERNTDGKRNVTEPENERTSRTRKGNSIDDEEEQPREADEGKNVDGIERIITVPSENVEAIIENAAENVGKRPSDAVEHMFIEEEKRTVAVVEKDSEMMKERTTEEAEETPICEDEEITDALKGRTNVAVLKPSWVVVEKDSEMMKGRTTEEAEETPICEDEGITDALKGRTNVAVLKPTWVVKEGSPGSMRGRALYTSQESLSDIAVKKTHKSLAKQTTENLETVEHKNIPVDVQQRPTNILREKNRNPIDEITSERKAVYDMEEKVIGKRSPNFTVENKYTRVESNSQDTECQTTHAIEEIHEGFTKAAEDKNCNASEEQASNTIREKYTEPIERRTLDPLEDAVENTTDASTEGNSNAVEERREKTHQSEADRCKQIMENMDAYVTEGENATTEEESNVSSEETNARSSKRRMKQALFSVTQPKQSKDEGDIDQGEFPWIRRLRRQEKFEWESEEASRPGEKGKKLRVCGVRRTRENVELREERTTKQELDKIKEVKRMEEEKKKIRNKNKRREKSTEEGSEEETEGKIKHQPLRKENGRKGKQQKMNQEKEGGIKTEKIERTQNENVMKEVEGGGKHGGEMERNEEDTPEETAESRRRERKGRKMEGNEREKPDENERKNQKERNRMGEKRKSSQKGKIHEPKKRKAEESKSASSRKELEKGKEEAETENQKCVREGENTRETEGRFLFKGGNFLNINKGPENILFSWRLKSTGTKKLTLTNFIKCGKLTRVIPDPLGSVRHSVYTMECRIHPGEERVTSIECGRTEPTEASSQGAHERRVMARTDRNIEKENLRKANTLAVRRGLVSESREDRITKENRNRRTEEGTVGNEKGFKIGNGRKRNTSSSSDAEMSLCSSRGLENRKRPQQLIGNRRHTSSSSDAEMSLCSSRGLENRKMPQQLTTQPRNSTVTHSSREPSYTSGVRQLKTKASKLKLFGLDSSNSSEIDEEKTVVNKSRKSKERKHRKVENLGHNRGMHCRPNLPLCSSVSETKSREQVQGSRTGELPTSRVRSHASSLVKNKFGEKSTPGKMPPERSCGSQGNDSDSSSDIPRHPFARRCKALLIASDSDDQVDNSRIFQRKRRRKRKARLSDRTVNEGSDSSSISDHSSLGKKRHLAHHITVKPCSPHARTQTDMQRKVNKKEVIPQIDHRPVATKKTLLSSQSFTPSSLPSTEGRARTLQEDYPAEETPSTPSNTIKRKRSVLLFETPPRPFRKQKRNSPFSQASMEHKADSSDVRNATYDPDGVEDQEEDSLMLPNVENDSAMLPEKGKDTQPRSESVTRELSNSSDQGENGSLVQSESDAENGLVIEESHDINCTESNLSSPSTPVASVKTQELGQRVPHLGPVVLIDRPKLKPKPAPLPAPAPKFTARAGPEYIDKLFSKLNQQTGVCSEANQIGKKSPLEPPQDSRSKQPQRNANAHTERTSSVPHLTQPLRGANYQGQSPNFLPNFYGTLGPAAANDSLAPPRHGPNFTLAQTQPSISLLPQPSSSHISSTSEQAKANLTSHTPGCMRLTHDHPHLTPTQPCSMPLKPGPAPGQPHSTPGHPRPVSGQPHSTPGHHPIPGEPSESLVPMSHPHQVPWLPSITTRHGKRLAPIPMEQMKETLEEVVATKIQSRWWKAGLNKICVSLTDASLPFFLRLVLETILRSDPLEPLQHYNGLPPRLFRLFQVVCVVEQRLAPQHPNGLRRALLRAIQAIVTQPDSRIRPHSLACLAAWYIASSSIDGHPEAGQEWGRGRAFLVDLLFHHPGTVHLSILTAARTCRSVFLKHVKYRELSGVEQVLIWLAHYGAWVGQPKVRSDLTEWLAQHLDSKKPPQNPATVTKKLIAMLDPEMNKDIQWGAVVGLVVLARWQGRLWAQKHLLPALSAAATKITTIVKGDLIQQEDLKTKISHLFDNLGQALPCGPMESQTGDVVKEMEGAVNTLLACHK